MRFITITQYFNKLQSVLLVLLIVPLLIFTGLYFFSGEIAPDRSMEYLVIIPLLVLLDWLIASIIFNKKIKSVRNAQGLGAKLDKYFHITIVRYCFLSAASLVMALGFYLTGSDLFIGLYVVGLLWSGFLWPSARRVCGDLKLRGDEYEMVYYKRDQFQ